MINKNLYRDLTPIQLNKQLMLACTGGDLDKIKYLLTDIDISSSVNINFKDNMGDNILIWAAWKGHVEVIKYLLTSPDLKEYPSVNDKNKHGYNVLMMACEYDKIDIVQFLIIDLGVKVDNETKIWLEGKNNMLKKYFSVLKLIELRDLNNKLNDGLPYSDNNNKKIKGNKI